MIDRLELIHDLIGDGGRLIEGAGELYVEPAVQLSAELVDRLRTAKTELKRILDEPAQPCPACGGRVVRDRTCDGYVTGCACSVVSGCDVRRKRRTWTWLSSSSDCRASNFARRRARDMADDAGTSWRTAAPSVCGVAARARAGTTVSAGTWRTGPCTRTRGYCAGDSRACHTATVGPNSM